MSNINLSYIITTFNKLEFLKVTVPILVSNCKTDEEIVVIDAGSSDGTEKYLLELYENGQIHQFVSEKDSGEAHGFNKAMMLAKGKLLKIVTDDDVYDFEVINTMKEFMLEHPDYEMSISNLCSTDFNDSEGKILFLQFYEVWFKEWCSGVRPNTFFCGLTMMISKQALPRLGLFDTSFKYIDLEYSIRATYKKAKIKFFSELMVVSLINEKSNSIKWSNQNSLEIEKVSSYYSYEHTMGERTIFFTSLYKRILRKLKIIKYKVIVYPEHRFYLDTKVIKNDFKDLNPYLQTLLSTIKEYNKNNIINSKNRLHANEIVS